MFAIPDLGLQIVSQGKNHVVEENPSQFYRVKWDLFVFQMQSESYSTKPRDNWSVMVYNSHNDDSCLWSISFSNKTEIKI